MKRISNLSDITVAFDTLGCAKNLCDTNTMKDILISSGVKVTDDIDLCDCIILNTCAFIQSATQESVDTFFDYKNTYPNKKIIVSGCMCSRYKDKLETSLIEADAFVKCNDEDKILNYIKKIFNLDNVSISNKEENLNSQENITDNSKYVCSYVKISDGCNRQCSYCMIPKIRGKHKSIKYTDIKDDVINKIKHGAKEIVLVAQDCGSWGIDLNSKELNNITCSFNLAWLLDNLAFEFKDTYFRVLYIQPDAINKNLIYVIKKHQNLVNYFDIPIQHVSQDILKNMNRITDQSYIESKIKLIKSIIPEATLRTTLIAGFPGETNKDFNELVEFLNKSYFDYCGVFKYSDEEGSESSKLKNKIDDETISKRANLLQDVCDSIAIDKLDKKIQNIYKVLILGYEDNRLYGRASFQAPDVDGVVFIDKYNFKPEIGDIVNVKIISTEMYDLVGKIV